VSVRTPRARVEGLGTARSGVQHFWRQRLTAVALVPLAIWFAISALSLIGADRDTAIAFLGTPFNAIAMGLFVIAALIHMTLGLQTVIEDYIEREGTKLALFLLNQFFAWIVGAACLFALVKIALGAPLSGS
jgi:succinate dehydrogenase / fumarate reductase membrane anchor subunit